MRNFFYYIEFVFSGKDIIDNSKFNDFFNKKFSLTNKSFEKGTAKDIEYQLGSSYILLDNEFATFNMCKYTSNKSIEDIFVDFCDHNFKNKFKKIYDYIINNNTSSNIDKIKQNNKEMFDFIESNKNNNISLNELKKEFYLQLNLINNNKEKEKFLQHLKSEKILRQIEYEVYVTRNGYNEYNLAFRPIKGEYLTKLNSVKIINILLNNIFKIVLEDNAFRVNNEIINVFSALRMDSSNKKKKSNEEQNISKDLIRAKAGKSGARHFIYEKFLKKYLIGKNYNLKIGVNSLQIIPKNFNKS